MLMFSSSLAIGWAHFRLAGGFKSAAIVAGAYLVMFSGLIGVTTYVASTSMGGGTRSMLEGWTIGLLVMQGLILVIGGSIRISGCIRHDISSRMIESHRLMPVTNSEAVAGYLWGGGGQVLAAGSMNALLTYIVGTAGGVDLLSLTTSHFVLAFFAIFLWTLIALGTFVIRYLILFLGGALMLGVCTFSVFYAVYIMPGLLMLLSPFIGETVFKLVPLGSSDAVFLYPVSMAGQTLLAIVFFLAAGRRYRGTYPTTFRVWHSIVILGVWCGLSLVGMIFRKNIMWTAMGGMAETEGFLGAQMISSFISAMLIALLPLWSVIADDVPKGLRGVASAAVIVLTWFMLSAMLLASPGRDNWTLLALVMVFGAQTLGAWAVMYLFRKMPMLAIVGILAAAAFIFWLLPLLAELVMAIMLERQDAEISLVGMLSPIGSMLTVWHLEPQQPILLAAAIQLVLALLLAGLAIMRALAAHRKSAVTVPPLQPQPS